MTTEDETRLPPAHEEDLRIARKLATWMDDRLLDPIIGFLFPGAGDILTATAGLYTVVVAIRLRASAATVARMLINLAVDALLGAIPVVGDLFDVFYRANRRNVELLERRFEAQIDEDAPRGTWRDWLYVVVALILFMAALSLPILALGWAFARIVQFLDWISI